MATKHKSRSFWIIPLLLTFHFAISEKFCLAAEPSYLNIWQIIGIPGTDVLSKIFHNFQGKKCEP